MQIYYQTRSILSVATCHQGLSETILHLVYHSPLSRRVPVNTAVKQQIKGYLQRSRPTVAASADPRSAATMILASVSQFGLVRGSASHPEALPAQPWPRSHLKRHGPASILSWERQAMRFQSLLSCNAHSGPRRGDEKPGRWESQLPVGSVPLSLADRYRNVCQPARKNMRYSVAVQEFVEASILAFECGHSEESLRQEIPAAGADESPFDGVRELRAVLASRCTAMTLPLGATNRHERYGYDLRVASSCRCSLCLLPAPPYA